MRRTMSSCSSPLNAAGAERSELSMRIATSAWLRAGRCVEPERMTSSIDDARIDLKDDSPITHLIASTRFDFPQPFGPTTPVKPGSTKDLNPSSRSRVSFMRQRSMPAPSRPALFRVSRAAPDERALFRSLGMEQSRWRFSDLKPGGTHRAASRRRMNRSPRRGNRGARQARGFPDLSPGGPVRTARVGLAERNKKPLSALEIGVNDLGHFVDRHGPFVNGTVD